MARELALLARAACLAAGLATALPPAAASQGPPSRQNESAQLMKTGRLGFSNPVGPVASSPMSCGEARLISAPLGGAAGALGGLLLYELLNLLGGEPEAPTSDPATRDDGRDRFRVVLVGAGLGVAWGFVAPPFARRCWIRLPGQPSGDASPPRADPPRRP